MPTKEELESELARVTAELEETRAELELAEERATAPAAAPAAPRRPWLSEGERQELERFGVTNSPFTGERVTREQALAELADAGQHGVVIGEPDPEFLAVMAREAAAGRSLAG